MPPEFSSPDEAVFDASFFCLRRFTGLHMKTFALFFHKKIKFSNYNNANNTQSLVFPHPHRFHSLLENLFVVLPLQIGNNGSCISQSNNSTNFTALHGYLRFILGMHQQFVPEEDLKRVALRDRVGTTTSRTAGAATDFL